MSSPYSKRTALLCCVFLGYLGIHRFYVGKTWSGFFYTLTLGLFGIGVVVDVFLLLTNRFRDKGGCILDLWQPDNFA